MMGESVLYIVLSRPAAFTVRQGEKEGWKRKTLRHSSRLNFRHICRQLLIKHNGSRRQRHNRPATFVPSSFDLPTLSDPPHFFPCSGRWCACHYIGHDIGVGRSVKQPLARPSLSPPSLSFPASKREREIGVERKEGRQAGSFGSASVCQQISLPLSPSRSRLCRHGRWGPWLINCESFPRTLIKLKREREQLEMGSEDRPLPCSTCNIPSLKSGMKRGGGATASAQREARGRPR